MSTIKVTNIQHASASTAAIALDSSGQATLNGLNFPTAGPLSSRNLIVNGAMAVAQRGTSQTSVSDGSNEGYTTVDRFPFYFSSGTGGTATLSQSTDVPSNQGFSNSYKADVTATATLSAGHTIIMQYLVEAQDLRNSGWNYTDTSSYLTLSFWAKSSKSGTHCVFFDMEDGSNNQHRNEEYTLTADTWEKITISLPGHANHVVNNDTGRGLNIQWLLASSASATAGSWVDSGDRGTSNQVNVFDSTDGEFFLTGVQLEVGQVATPFEHRRYGDELARCQRYYFRVTSGGNGEAVGAGTAQTSHTGGFLTHLPVPMRVAPSALETTGTVSDYRIQNGGSTNDCTNGPTFGESTETMLRISAVSQNNLSAGNAILLRFQASSTTSFLAVSAEL